MVYAVPKARVHPAQVKEMAEAAADFYHGPQANPFPVDDANYAVWNRHYYARVKENAEAVVS